MVNFQSSDAVGWSSAVLGASAAAVYAVVIAVMRRKYSV